MQVLGASFQQFVYLSMIGATGSTTYHFFVGAKTNSSAHSTLIQESAKWCKDAQGDRQVSSQPVAASISRIITSLASPGFGTSMKPNPCADSFANIRAD